MSDKELNVILTQRLDSLQRQINEINSSLLPFFIGVEEEVASLRREVDEMYYVKGAELIENQQKRLKQFHAIVLDEMELSDESIFHKNHKKSKASQDELFARNTLMYMLNKHIPELSYTKLSVLYGVTLTCMATGYKKYLANPIDRQIIDRIDNRIVEMLSSQRPYDGHND